MEFIRACKVMFQKGGSFENSLKNSFIMCFYMNRDSGISTFFLFLPELRKSNLWYDFQKFPNDIRIKTYSERKHGVHSYVRMSEK